MTVTEGLRLFYPSFMMHVVVLYLLSFGVLLALADVTYNIDDTDPSITYVGRWHQENDYTTSYNFTLSNALDQDDGTTASLIFYGTSLVVYGTVRTNADFEDWGTNATVTFFLDGTETTLNATYVSVTPPSRRRSRRESALVIESSPSSLTSRIATPEHDTWILFQSPTLSLAKHLIVMADVGSFIYLDYFAITAPSLPSSLASLSTSSSSATLSVPASSSSTIPSTQNPASSGSSTVQDPSSSSALQPTTVVTATRHKNDHAGAIAGGVVGGVCAAGLVLAVFVFFRRREHESPRSPLDIDEDTAAVQAPISYNIGGNPDMAEVHNNSHSSGNPSYPRNNAGSQRVGLLGDTENQNQEAGAIPSISSASLSQGVHDNSATQLMNAARPNGVEGVGNEATVPGGLEEPAPSEYQTVYSTLPPPYTPQ